MSGRSFSSLGSRLIAVVVGTAFVAFASFVGLTVMRLQSGLDRETVELGTLSEDKLAQELSGKAQLARARVELLVANTQRRLEAIALRADALRAVASRNSVAMNQVLGPAARTADIDGVLVVDAELRVIGSDKGEVDLVATNEALQRSTLIADLRPLVENNDRRRPRESHKLFPIDADVARSLGAYETSPMAALMAVPVFDDFGDVAAVLVAYRSIKPHEPILEEFAQLEGTAGVIVMINGGVISRAGIPDTVVSLDQPRSKLGLTGDGNFWGRCSSLEQIEVCALAPLGELHRLRDEMVRIAKSEGRSLIVWLLLSAAAAIVVFALLTFIASRQITLPLSRITDAVRAVARGDWKSDVPGAERLDEIGDIARAVRQLQRSLAERDRLKSDFANATTVIKRRDGMEDSIRQFDRNLRAVLLTVSDGAEALDEASADLGRLAALAESETVEAAFVAEGTVASMTAVRRAAEEISASVSETRDQLIRVTELVAAGALASELAMSRMQSLNRAVVGVDSLRSAGVVRQASGERASRRSRATPPPLSDPALPQETLDQLRDTAAGLNGALAQLAATLGDARRRADLVAMVVVRQEETARAISGAAQAGHMAALNVANSIERVRLAVEEAREASSLVAARSSDMADEAQRLESTVKTFLADVTA